MSRACICCKTSTTKNTVLFGVTSFQDYLQWWPLHVQRILKSSLLCGKRYSGRWTIYWFDGFTQIVPLRGQVPWKARIRDVDIIPTEARWAFHIKWNSKWQWRRLVPRSIQNCMQNTEIILNSLGGEFDPRHSSPSSRRPISNITFLLWVTLQKSLWRESDSSDKIITKWDPILSTKCTNGLSNASLVNL